MADQEQAREEFTRVCQRAFNLGLQRSTGGNLSMRLTGGRFLAKPSGLSLFELTAADLLLCDGEGRVLEGQGKPTKEIAAHLAVYRVRPEVAAVVHYHPPHATAFAAASMEVPLLTVHARRILGSLPVIGPPGEGGDELVQPLSRFFGTGQHRAALLAEHGIITVGSSLTQAHNLAELVEESAHIAWLQGLLPKTTRP